MISFFKPKVKAIKKLEIPWKIVHNIEEGTFEIHNEFGYWTAKKSLKEAQDYIERNKYDIVD